MKAYLLVCVLFSAFGFASQIKQLSGLAQGLKFDNFTFYYDDKFISAFGNFINSASSFYKNDTEKRLEYISDKLNQNFPVDKRRYSVFQENGTVTINYQSGWYVWNFRTIASLDNGVDKQNPILSYMINQEYTWNRTFISKVGSKGEGLKDYQEQYITKQIMKFEQQNPLFCACHVGQLMRNQFLQSWNHFCSSVENRHAVSAYVFDERWIYFKPARCYHLLYLKYPGYE